MIKGTRAAIAARLESVERERTLLGFALSAKMNGDKPTAIERWSDDDERYVAALYHPAAPHGGFVVVTFRYPGQKDMHSVFYADEWCQDSIAHGIAVGRSGLATAAEHIRAAARHARLERSA